MGISTGYSRTVTSGSIFVYDTGDTFNSYIGEPTTNLVPSPYPYGLYAYASGPVDTTVQNETGNTITAKRYTVTNAVNVARAAIVPSTTANTNYTFSFKWKYNGSTTTSPVFVVSAAKGNPEGGANNNTFNSETTTTTAIGNGWYLTIYTFNFSSNPTSACTLTFGLQTGGTASYVGETYDVYQAQFELKDHKTQYVLGSRSATQGLLDVSGYSNSVDLSNVSFNSNAQMTFNGTSNYINTNIPSLGANCTLELIIQSSAYGGTIPISIDSDNYSYGPDIYFTSNIIAWNTGDGATNAFSNSSYPNANYHHIVVTNISGTGATLYIDGIPIGTAGSLNATTTGANKLWIGRLHGAGYYMTGSIPVVKVYNRALSGQEVAQNFAHYQTRFGLPTGAMSASQLKAQGITTNGVYWLQPPGAPGPFQAYVDFTTPNGPWVHVGTALGNSTPGDLWPYPATWVNRVINYGTAVTDPTAASNNFNSNAFIYCKGNRIMLKEGGGNSGAGGSVGYTQATGLSNESWRDMYAGIDMTAWPTTPYYRRILTIDTNSRTVSSSSLIYGTNWSSANVYDSFIVYAFDAGNDTMAMLTTAVYNSSYAANGEADIGVGANESGAGSGNPTTPTLGTNVSYDMGSNGTSATGWQGVPFSLWIQN